MTGVTQHPDPAGGWEQRIERFWAVADDSRPREMLEAMRELIGERVDGDALFEWASVHDFLGREAEAIPLYRQALDAGITPPRQGQAIVQLGSSLRNVGRAAEAVEVLSGQDDPAARAFLALALYDSGRPAEALRTALTTLAPTLPMYQRAVTAYADDLGRRNVVGSP